MTTKTVSTVLRPVYLEVLARRDAAWLAQAADAPGINLDQPREAVEDLARQGGRAVAAADAHRIVSTYPDLPDSADLAIESGGAMAEVWAGMTTDEQAERTRREWWWFHQGRVESYARVMTALEATGLIGRPA